MQRFIIHTIICLFILQQANSQIKNYIFLNEVTISKKPLVMQGIEQDLSIDNNQKKSVFIAVAASLLVPGMGELYVGSLGAGKYHLIAEGGLWMTYAGFQIHSNWLKRDAQTFAKQHAGADFNNKDEKYPVNIGNFNSTDDYNQTKLRNREYELIYTGPQYNWLWDNEQNRIKFKDLRIRSDAAKNNSKFVIAAVVVNHLISAFSAGRKAAAYNKSLASLDEISINAFTINNGYNIDGIGLNITKEF